MKTSDLVKYELEEKVFLYLSDEKNSLKLSAPPNWKDDNSEKFQILKDNKPLIIELLNNEPKENHFIINQSVSWPTIFLNKKITKTILNKLETLNNTSIQLIPESIKFLDDEVCKNIIDDQEAFLPDYIQEDCLFSDYFKEKLDEAGLLYEKEEPIWIYSRYGTEKLHLYWKLQFPIIDCLDREQTLDYRNSIDSDKVNQNEYASVFIVNEAKSKGQEIFHIKENNQLTIIRDIDKLSHFEFDGVNFTSTKRSKFLNNYYCEYYLDKAIRKKNFEIVKWVVDQYETVDNLTSGDSPLLYVLKYNMELNIFNYILKNGTSKKFFQQNIEILLKEILSENKKELKESILYILNNYEVSDFTNIFKEAMEYEDEEILTKLIKLGAPLTIKSNVANKTILHIACAKGWLNMTKALVETGMDLNIMDDYTNTPIMNAFSGGHLEIINYLISKGAKIDSKEHTYFFKSIYSHDINTVMLAHEYDKNIQTTDSSGQNALHIEAFHHVNHKNQSLDLIRFYIEVGVDINHLTENGIPPIYDAIHSGKVEIVKLFLENGAKLIPKAGKTTAFEKAVITDNIRMLEFIIDELKDITPYIDNQLLIESAISDNQGSIEVFEKLINLGCDKNVKSEKWDSKTCLAACLHYSRDHKKAEYIIDNQLYADDENWDNCLLYAVENEWPIDTIKKILSFNPDLKARNENNKTAVSLAKYLEDKEITKALNNYKKNLKKSSIGSQKEIQEILKDEKSSFEKVKQAIMSIDSAEEFFNVKAYGETPEKIPFYDNSIKRHIKKFDNNTLLHIVNSTFTNTSLLSSMQATIIAVDEIIERKATDIQKKIVDTFDKCSTHYDVGHINYTNSVHEYLIGAFKSFEKDAQKYIKKKIREDIQEEMSSF
jgi:ankyrin repeat protein